MFKSKTCVDRAKIFSKFVFSDIRISSQLRDRERTCRYIYNRVGERERRDANTYAFKWPRDAFRSIRADAMLTSESASRSISRRIVKFCYPRVLVERDLQTLSSLPLSITWDRKIGFRFHNDIGSLNERRALDTSGETRFRRDADRARARARVRHATRPERNHSE